MKTLSVANQSPWRGSFLPKKALIINAITGERKIGAILPTEYYIKDP